jgi:hypothetical protein
MFGSGVRQVSLPSTSFTSTRREKQSRVFVALGRGQGQRQRSSVQLGALKVSFQGVHGAYSEQAARKAYPDGDVVPCPDFETTHRQVQNLSVDRAVVPVENSLGQYILFGKTNASVDALLYHQEGETPLYLSAVFLLCLSRRKWRER